MGKVHGKPVEVANFRTHFKQRTVEQEALVLWKQVNKVIKFNLANTIRSDDATLRIRSKYGNLSV